MKPRTMHLDRRTRLFIVLAAVFVTALVVGDIIGGKLVVLDLAGLPVTISVGMIPFPLTFLLTDVLNEFYGQKATRFVTWVGLGMAIFSFAVLSIAVRIPIAPFTQAADWQGVTGPAFNNVFNGSQRILVASLLAYLIGQIVDISVFHALKAATGHRFLWLRSTGSTVVSQLVDTLAIQTIAWYGLMPFAQVVPIAAASYAVKLVIAVALTPVIYLMHGFIVRWLAIPNSAVEERTAEST